MRAMAYRMHRTLIASLSAAALMFAASETSARPAAAHSGGFRSTHPISRSAMGHSLRQHRRNNAQAFWPAGADSFYGSDGEPMIDVTPPGSGDIRSTYDVPWDWAHRYPPAVIPSDRPYVPSCPSETVTVPGRHGQPQTVSVMRCY